MEAAKMSDYRCPWPSEAARGRAHIDAIIRFLREKGKGLYPDDLGELASIHLEFARPDMAAERRQEEHSAPCGGVEARQCDARPEVGQGGRSDQAGVQNASTGRGECDDL